MTIVITGITGFRNRGVEAFTIPTIIYLQKQYPGEPIAILTSTPNYDSQRVLELDVALVGNDFSLGAGTPTVRRLRQKIARLLGKQPRSERNKANQLLKSARMVVSLGGDTFSSDYGQLHRHLEPLAYAQQHGVPMVFLAHSIGPFRTAVEADAWSQVARQSALITVRESLTYQYVTKQLSIPENLVHLTCDPAFLLARPSPEYIKRMFAGYGIALDRPKIALAVSQSIGDWGNVSRQAHFEAWSKTIEALLETTEAELLLVPHVQNQSTETDDRLVATKLLQRIQFHPRLRLIGGDHSAAEFKGLIGACDMVVAERMHAAIAGLSSGICTMVIGYSVKAEGILSDLFTGTELLGDLLLPVQQLAVNDTLQNSVLNVWQKRDFVKQSLRASLPQAQRAARKNYQLISEKLGT